MQSQVNDCKELVQIEKDSFQKQNLATSSLRDIRDTLKKNLNEFKSEDRTKIKDEVKIVEKSKNLTTAPILTKSKDNNPFDSPTGSTKLLIYSFYLQLKMIGVLPMIHLMLILTLKLMINGTILTHLMIIQILLMATMVVLNLATSMMILAMIFLLLTKQLHL